MSFLTPQFRRSRADVLAKGYPCEFPGCTRRYYFKWHLQRHQRDKHPDFASASSSSHTDMENTAESYRGGIGEDVSELESISDYKHDVGDQSQSNDY
jgi:hypothetical protein